MFKLSWPLALFSAVLMFAFDDAHAAPNVEARNIDIDLKAADVRNVFGLLEQISKRRHQLDACVQGAVSLRLQNVPLPLVYDALASKLGLTYDEDGASVTVRCGRSTDPLPQQVQTLELDLVDADVRTLFDLIGRFTRRKHVTDSCVHGTVTIRLSHVPVPVVYEALAQKLGLTYVHDGDVTRVGCR
jgi:type II secretory pathway component HofQ